MIQFDVCMFFGNLTCPGPVQLAFSLWWGNPFRPWKNWKPIWWEGECGNPSKRTHILLDSLFFWVIFYGLYHPGSSRYVKFPAFWLGFCGWFLIFWHNFLHTKGRSRNGKSPVFTTHHLGDYVFNLFPGIESSRKSKFGRLALDSQSSNWHVVREKWPEVNISTESTDLGKRNKSCSKKNTLEKLCRLFFWRFHICILFFPLTSTTWVFPVFILKVRAFRIKSW